MPGDTCAIESSKQLKVTQTQLKLTEISHYSFDLLWELGSTLLLWELGSMIIPQKSYRLNHTGIKISPSNRKETFSHWSELLFQFKELLPVKTIHRL